MLAGAARTWLNRYGVQVGRRAVIVTADDEAVSRARSARSGLPLPL